MGAEDRAQAEKQIEEQCRAGRIEDATAEALRLLRVDKQLAWADIARVMLAEGEAAAEAVVKRESARLRKRFELLKQKLLELGRREGLVRSKASLHKAPGGG